MSTLQSRMAWSRYTWQEQLDRMEREGRKRLGVDLTIMLTIALVATAVIARFPAF